MKVSIMLVPGLMAITGHELAHGYVAFRCGDDTASRMGRLTFNPLRHIDVVGMLLLFLIGIGWAKPVPVNFSNLRKPRQQMIFVSAAGPLTNVFLALAAGLLLRGLYLMASSMPGISVVSVPLMLMLAFGVYINLVLAIFNLIPFPPLDGGRIMIGLLPPVAAAFVSRFESYGLILVMLLVFLFPSFLSAFIGPPLYAGLNLFIGSEILQYLKTIPSFSQLRLFPF